MDQGARRLLPQGPVQGPDGVLWHQVQCGQGWDPAHQQRQVRGQGGLQVLRGGRRQEGLHGGDVLSKVSPFFKR